jgi:hypothetical protein
MNLRALSAGLKVVEVPSFESRRIYGTGHLRTIPDGWRVLLTIWREWRSPLRHWRTAAWAGGPEGQFAEVINS